MGLKLVICKEVDFANVIPFFFILFTCLIHFKIFNFFLKDGFYLINWSASKYDFWQGGKGGLANFWFWLTSYVNSPISKITTFVTNTQTDKSTYKKHWPRGPMLWKRWEYMQDNLVSLAGYPVKRRQSNDVFKSLKM